MVYEDTFSTNTLNPVWTKEVEVGGFGNGQFEETTGTDENIFIKDAILNIQPTLQDTKLLNTNYTLNLTALGTCTSTLWSDCIATTNTTNGTIINPVKSGRLNTKKGANLRYGRVEVVARMPEGDWLWPAIWLLPTSSVYGPWPKSGEIDIAESRGNNHTYPPGGNNIVTSSLHWGPDTPDDSWWRTTGRTKAFHSTFAQQFHTYGLEWSEKYLYTYLDGRLLQVLYTGFTTSFWNRGDFSLSYPNGTSIVNPWAGGSTATPFDQNFYLVLNVAVGGTNGWFKDGKAGKPWVDTSATANTEFWKARDQW
jgi:beta-glucanase (GH16 family)